MEVTATVIPGGSYSLRIFRDGVVPDESDIDTVLILQNEGNGVCQAALAHGNLYNEANFQIGLKAIELGFHELLFHVRKGTHVTRYAEKIDEDEYFDYYRVDLMEVLAKTLIGLAL